jgi:hypothetical protein
VEVRKLARVLAIIVSIAAVGLIAACGGGSGHSACADKVSQEFNTDKSVAGVWNCLAPSLQNIAITRGVKKGDDALFTDGGSSPVISYAFVTETNGMDIYSAVVKDPYTGKTFGAVLVLYVDSNGLVTNLGVATPTL